MFDATSRQSYKDVPFWFKNVIRVCENVPICLVANKIDEKERTVKSKMVVFHRKKNLQYYEMSALGNINVEKPFLYLLRKLAGSPDLAFSSAPLLKAITIKVDEKWIEQQAKDFEIANQPILPDDDEDDF
mmetsp:Transcript_5146/g.4365  ORF Transcript_5146/g.4365 Transcript_5146/m.4365 type:complete len:130 (+) Transcript_5146:279-668(+)